MRKSSRGALNADGIQRTAVPARQKRGRLETAGPMAKVMRLESENNTGGDASAILPVVDAIIELCHEVLGLN